MIEISSELVQLVDGSGHFIRAAQRHDLNACDGEYMLVAEAVLFLPDGDVLFQKRGFGGSEPLKIDHVCGAVGVDETPEQAVMREAREEVELTCTPRDLMKVHEGVNSYGRYKVLFRGVVEMIPIRTIGNREVSFIGAASLSRLEAMRSRGRVFVDDFFNSIHTVRNISVL